MMGLKIPLENFDLVLLDIEMPQMSRFSVYSIFRLDKKRTN